MYCERMKLSSLEISEIFKLKQFNLDFDHYCDSSLHAREGSLFFAFKGNRVDGHDFLDEVLCKGAKAAVVSHSYTGAHKGLELIRVPCVNQALHTLAKYVLSKRDPLIIGVTGSVGKTSTKEFIATILSEKFSVFKTHESQNSQVLLPLNLLNWMGNDEILVLEMGVDRKGQLSKHIAYARPHIAVLTKIGLSHSVNFSSIEEIAAEKCMIFKSDRLQFAFLNRDTKRFKAVKELSIPRLFYGESDLKTHFTEQHILENIGCAVAVARYLGVNDHLISEGITSLNYIDKRGKRIIKKGIIFIDDSFNASPLSMIASLNAIPHSKRKIGIIGSMKELGSFEVKAHSDIARKAVKALDIVYCLGSECQVIVDLFNKFGKRGFLMNSISEILDNLRKTVTIDDVVLLKGSNVHRLWTVVEEF